MPQDPPSSHLKKVNSALSAASSVKELAFYKKWLIITPFSKHFVLLWCLILLESQERGLYVRIVFMNNIESNNIFETLYTFTGSWKPSRVVLLSDKTIVTWSMESFRWMMESMNRKYMGLSNRKMSSHFLGWEC